MNFTLKGNPSEKIGWYRSIFSKDYQVRRCAYDAKIRNWEIEFQEPNFIVVDSDGCENVVFKNFYQVDNCTCDFFIRNESGTCMHIEAINLIDSKSISDVKKSMRSWKNITHVNHLMGNVQNPPRSKFKTLSVELYEDYKRSLSRPLFDISKIFEWNLFKEFGINLYDYQILSIKEMIKNKKTILTLKMGLGKTICALICCKILNPKKVLIVCPNNLKYQWKSEIERFNLGRCLVIDSRKDLKKKSDETFMVISYEMLNHNVEISDDYYDILIADEVQKIKNPESISWRNMNKIKSEFTFSLSGTPVQNSIGDILSVIRFLNPNEFNPEWKFWDEYCEFTRAKILGIKKHKIQKFREKISSYIINPIISKSSVKLPSYKEHTISCILDGDSRRLHNGYLDIARPLIAKSFHYSLSFSEKAKLNSLLTAARVASTDARLIDPNSIKSDRFFEIEKTISNIISNGEKVVVYSEWIKATKLLIDHLNKNNIGYSIFNSELSSKKKDIEFHKFLNDPNTKVFLSTDSGGLGIDGLQLASNNVIHIEKVWNPAKIHQRNGRIVRNLQKKSLVNIYYFTCNSEVEKMIDDSSFRKTTLIDDILR